MLNYFEFGPVGSGGDIVYRHFLSRALAAPLFNGVESFVQFCEIILNLEQWFRKKCHYMYFLSGALISPCVQRSITICASLVEGIMRNNSVNFFLNLGLLFRRRCRLKDYLSGALAALLFVYAIMKNGNMENIHVKLYEIWTSGSGGDVV